MNRIPRFHEIHAARRMLPVTGKALVVGYGNPLRCDDGAGQAVATALAEAALDNVEVVICHQLTPELSERIAAVELVLFVDAQLGGHPGSITISRVRHDPATPWTALVHHVNPATLLSLSLELFGRSPKAFLVTVAAGSFELNERLTQPVAIAIPHVLTAIRQLIMEQQHGD